MAMNENTKVNLVKKLDVTDLSGEKVMIDFSTGKYFLLKGSANEIWDILTKNTSNPISVNEIRNSLMEIYDVDADTCLSSVISFLTQIEKNNFIICS
jgi:hypothetical protein